MVWRAVSYCLPGSLEPENTSNEHRKPENGTINGRGHVWKLGESASVSSVMGTGNVMLTIKDSETHCMEGDQNFATEDRRQSTKRSGIISAKDKATKYLLTLPV